MPTYEYACRECGEHTEAQQSFSDAPLTECPACHGPLRKVFGNIGIAFKGSGFYKTDSRNSGAKKGKTGGEGTDGANGKAKSDAGAGAGTSSKESPTSSSSSSLLLLLVEVASSSSVVVLVDPGPRRRLVGLT